MRKLEILNTATGSILVVTGVIHFLQSSYTAGFSWLIFGSMYLVMDSYKVHEKKGSFENASFVVRKVFAWIGFLASLALFIYTIVQIQDIPPQI